MIDYAQGSGKQYHIGVTPKDVGEYVILPGDPKRCKIIAGYLDDAKLVGDNREFVTYTGYLCGKKVSITSTGIGGPSAAIALEELVHCGAHTFIRVGTSGGMQPEIEGGDLVVATGAIRMEGTSREYTPIEFPAVADFTVVNALVNSASELKATYHVGVVQSKDSFYGQHEPEKKPVSATLLQNWEAWKMAGALASEMETAALYVVASYLRVRMGAIFLVLANQERERLGLSNKQVHDMDMPIKVAIKAIEKLINNE